MFDFSGLYSISKKFLFSRRSKTTACCDSFTKWWEWKGGVIGYRAFQQTVSWRCFWGIYDFYELVEKITRIGKIKTFQITRAQEPKAHRAATSIWLESPWLMSCMAVASGICLASPGDPSNRLGGKKEKIVETRIHPQSIYWPDPWRI